MTNRISGLTSLGTDEVSAEEKLTDVMKEFGHETNCAHILRDSIQRKLDELTEAQSKWAGESVDMKEDRAWDGTARMFKKSYEELRLQPDARQFVIDTLGSSREEFNGKSAADKITSFLLTTMVMMGTDGSYLAEKMLFAVARTIKS